MGIDATTAPEIAPLVRAQQAEDEDRPEAKESEEKREEDKRGEDERGEAEELPLIVPERRPAPADEFADDLHDAIRANAREDEGDVEGADNVLHIVDDEDEDEDLFKRRKPVDHAQQMAALEDNANRGVFEQ